MTDTLHVELSNRCVLQCPGCPRTWFANQFGRPVPKADLDLDAFARFMDCKSGRAITHFHLESNHGDSIYSPELLFFLNKWRSSKTFHIVTNGARQKLQFWQDLYSIMTPDDQITFSIDGNEDTNHLYRVNSDWHSIMSGLKIMISSQAKVTWKMIVFRHNQHQIDLIKQLATDLGVDDFRLVKTARFGDDRLRPDDNMIAHDRLYETKKNANSISPRCDNGKGSLYISAEGYTWPCCWISSFFTLHKTNLWGQRHNWNIRDHNLDQVLTTNQIFSDDVKNFPERADSVCKMHCGKIDQ